MPHKHLIFKFCRPTALLVHMAKLNQPLITLHEREKLLDEIDALVASRRGAKDKESVHKLLETAHWISKWPTVANMNAILTRKETQ